MVQTGIFRQSTRNRGPFWVVLVSLIATTFPVLAGSDVKQSGETEASPMMDLVKGDKISKQGRANDPILSDEYMDYVRDNVTATLYHEFAHAMVDMLDLPVYGQEEDAADVLSIVMIQTRHPDPEATRIVRLSSEAYAIAADKLEDRGEYPLMWDEHGPARQRYYNAVCLFYGANPDTRADFAKQMGLPDSRADYCHSEYQLAAKSWLPALGQLRGEGQKIRFRDKSRDQLGQATAETIAKLVDDLNSDFSMPEKLEILLKRCGGDDRGYEAFYSEYFEGESGITVCTEYVRDLYRTASGVW